MATAIRPIGHEDRLSLVDHLEELRTRLIVCGVAFGLAFGLCLWQNHELLHIINGPLSAQTKKQVREGHGPLGQTALAEQGVRALARETQAIARTLSEPGSGLSASARARLRAQAASVNTAVAKVPASPEGDKPFTLGIGEPFTTTLTVALYFALVLSLPIILFEMYGFVLPALKPRERRVAVPLVMAVPFLFAVGVVFGYLVVLPAAVRFFQNFNSAEFNVVVQANQYYRFAGTVLLAMGLVFQVPVAIIGATRLGVVTPKTLRKHRRYALLACAAIAAFLPGDAVTMVLETVPLYLLYELSIVLASLMERRDSAKGAQGRETGARAGAGAAAEQGAEQGGAGGGDAGERSEVERIIDHVDERL